MALAPYPARSTLFSLRRHETPVRGAKFVSVRFTFTAFVVLPYPATRTVLVAGS
jgi:hypothetical protein